MDYEAWKRIWVKTKYAIKHPVETGRKIWKFINHDGHEGLEIFLTVAAIVVAWCLLSETQKQVRISQEQVDVGREGSKKELKSYVYVIPDQADSIYKTFKDSTKINVIIAEDSAFSYLIRNYGKTPAYKVAPRVFFFWQVEIPNLTPDLTDTIFSFTLPPESQISILGKIYPGTDFSVRKKDITYWIAGTLRYVDVFKDTTFVNFCYKYIFIHHRFVTVRYDEVVKPCKSEITKHENE